MAANTGGEPCAAHNCLRPRWKEGWCTAHWYAHHALLLHYSELEDNIPDSLAICQAIWDAS
jgi:hypothetical protein